MRLFRLCRQKDAELTGYGAKRTGGRWNRKGIFALYTAEHASLAVVEVLVHLDRTEIPSDFVFLEVSVADEYILTLPTAESNEEFLKSVYQTGAEALPPNIVGFSVPSVVVPLHAIAVRADALSSRSANACSVWRASASCSTGNLRFPATSLHSAATPPLCRHIRPPPQRCVNSLPKNASSQPSIASTNGPSGDRILPWQINPSSWAL